MMFKNLVCEHPESHFDAPWLSNNIAVMVNDLPDLFRDLSNNAGMCAFFL